MLVIIQGDTLTRGPKLLSISLQVCLDVKGDYFQHRLCAGPVFHHSQYVYLIFKTLFQ
jgi:hypothetical protein